MLLAPHKRVYFVSDAHLGTPYHRLSTSDAVAQQKQSHAIERKLCRWLDSIKKDAQAIFMLGDMFDFWFDYKCVVPRGFTRFLGKVSELTDAGIEVHFFIGNHDIWLTDYFEKECGMIIHRQPLVLKINDSSFFLAHGDGLGDDSRSFKIIRSIFHNSLCRKLFATIHPRWSVAFAHKWARHSRKTGHFTDYMGEDKEHLVLFAKKQLDISPNINFFIFGHRHIILDLMLTHSTRIAILGDWIQHFSYGVFDGKHFSIELFESE